MLSRLLQVMAKINFKTVLEKSKADDKLCEPKKSQLDDFEANLRGKVKLAFGTAAELLQFMDLSSTGNVKIDEFLFGVSFFCEVLHFPLVLLLFKHLDTNSKGAITETDF